LINSEKVAFISGSTKGIGKAVAARFVRKGYTVIQKSRNQVKKE
jgi:NAD(P)-dependent dehydrogenase (short-subunit alcohol dehydrogenase family)